VNLLEKTILFKPSATQPPPLISLAVAPTGRKVACGTYDAQILLFDTKANKPLRALKGHEGIVSSVLFIDGGKHIISGSWDHTTRLWGLATEVKDINPIKANSEIKCLAIDTEFSKGAIGTRDGEVKIFSASKMKCIRNIQAHTKDVSGLAIINDGSQLITTSWDGACSIWNLSSYQRIHQIKPQKQRVRSLAVTPDESRLFLGLHDGKILAISLNDFKDRIKLSGHTDIVSALSVTQSGKYLASGSWDRTIRVWDIADGKQVERERAWTAISSVAWSPKDDIIYSTHFSGSLVAWSR
jgi:WD40 repeat protein